MIIKKEEKYTDTRTSIPYAQCDVLVVDLDVLLQVSGLDGGHLCIAEFVPHVSKH